MIKKMIYQVQIDEINKLKVKVSELVKSIQTLKNLLARSKISLNEFKEKKTSMEEELRDVLKKIAQYKEEIPTKPTPKEQVPAKEITILEKPTQKKLALKKKLPPPVKFPPTVKLPSKKKIPPQEKETKRRELTVDEIVRKLEERMEKSKTRQQTTRKTAEIQEGAIVKKQVRQIESKPHVKKHLEELGIVSDDNKVAKKSQFIIKEAQIAQEANDLMFHYQTDFDTSITRALIYLSITAQYHFIIEIDFSDYPEAPKLKIPSEIMELFTIGGKEIFKNVPSYFNWDANNPEKIYQIVSEVEVVLMKNYRTTTEKPQKVPLDITLIQEEIREKEVKAPEKETEKVEEKEQIRLEEIPKYQLAWYMFLIIITVSILILSTIWVNPLIPITTAGVLILFIYYYEGAETELLLETSNPENENNSE